MNRKIKINIDRKELTPEEIQKGRNFKTVFDKLYKRPKPFFKNPKLFGGLLFTALVVTFIVVEFEEKQKNEKVKKREESFINPPIDSLKPETTSNFLNVENGKTIHYRSGTNIIVPVNAFEDENGKTITGEVEIKYREMDGPIAALLSGISMQYDSGGYTYNFETAGMIDIQGYSKGKKVFIKKGKSIRIELASEQSGAGFNLYQLDTLKKNWLYLGKDSVVEEPVSNTALIKKDTSQTFCKLLKDLKTSKEEVKSIKQKEPVKPVLQDEARASFSIEVDEKDFPEIAVYKDVLFQLKENSFKNKMENDAREEWNDVKLTRDKGNYNVTFYKGEVSVTYHTEPVFASDKIQNANLTYNSLYEKYENKLKEKLAEEERQKDAFKKIVKEREIQFIARQKAWQNEQDSLNQAWAKRSKEIQLKVDSINKAYAERQRKLIEESEMRLNELNAYNKVKRVFDINQFGIINSDCPHKLPEGLSAELSFEDKNGNEIILPDVYLVEKGKRFYYKYYNTGLNNFKINPEKENTLWTVMNNRLILVPQSEIKRIKENKKYRLKIDPSGIEIKSEQQISDLLKI